MAEVSLENLKGNSNKGKVDPRPEENRVRKVANAREVKKTPGKKFVDTFIKGDAENIFDYVVGDVLIPTIVDTFIDICESTIEMLFRGERRDYRRNTSYTTRQKDKASYQAYYQSDRTRDRKVYESRGNGSFPLKDILVEGMETQDGYRPADEIVDDIYNAVADELREYQQVSVRYLYECAGITSTNFQDNNYGWRSMKGFGKRRVDRDSYILILPKPEAI